MSAGRAPAKSGYLRRNHKQFVGQDGINEHLAEGNRDRANRAIRQGISRGGAPGEAQPAGENFTLVADQPAVVGLGLDQAAGGAIKTTDKHDVSGVDKCQF